MQYIKGVFRFIKEVYSEWKDDQASRLSAALAYYTIFSIAPLLLMVIVVAGQIYGEQAVRGEIVHQIEATMGTEGAEAIQTMLENVYQEGSSTLATVIAAAVLIWGSTNVFSHLQWTLNTAWDVQAKPGRNILTMLREKFVLFALIPAVGFLLMVSLVVDAGLAALGNYFEDIVPDTVNVAALQAGNVILSFAVITVLFALIYKVLPDVRIRWRDIWIGAAITALLFTIGRVLIGLYIGRSSFASTYGAVGSLIVILLWVYYSAQIFFLGAEFTQVFARHYGKQIEPSKDAIALPTEDRLEMGRPTAAEIQILSENLPAPTGHAAVPFPQPVRKRVDYKAVAVTGLLAFIAGGVAGFLGKKDNDMVK
jgi:membrane protein